MMTRRDFIAIAQHLKQNRPGLVRHATAIEYAQWISDVEHVADALRCTSERFKRGTFLAVCGLDAEEITIT